MPTAFRFKRLTLPTSTIVNFRYGDMAVTAVEGDTVAAALLAHGIDFTRLTPVNQTPRAPFCMMGSCFDCLMEIDGIPNQQACQVLVVEGMVVKRMLGARSAHTEQLDD